MDILSYFPGQRATIFFEIKTADGYRADTVPVPFISQILGFTAIDGYTAYDGYFGHDGYTKPYTRLAVGQYFAQITLPKTASAVGCYFVNTIYTNPISGFPNTQTYQLIVNAPFGNFGATTG